MIKCNLMFNTQLSSNFNNHKRAFSQEKTATVNVKTRVLYDSVNLDVRNENYFTLPTDIYGESRV